jgi:hypothetical protein
VGLLSVILRVSWKYASSSAAKGAVELLEDQQCCDSMIFTLSISHSKAQGDHL